MMNEKKTLTIGVLKIDLIPSPWNIRALSDLPDQIIRLEDKETFEMKNAAIKLSLDENLDNEVAFAKLQELRKTAEFYNKFEAFYRDNGAAAETIVKTINATPYIQLIDKHRVAMGDLRAADQRTCCRMRLTYSVDLIAYRGQRSAHFEWDDFIKGIRGIWSTGSDSGVWKLVVKHDRHIDDMVTDNIEGLVDELNDEFLKRWPMFGESGMEKHRIVFRSASLAEMRKYFGDA